MYTKILVPIDGSETAERGLKEAIRLAAGQQQRPTLYLLHVVHDISMVIEMSAVQSADETLAYLKKFGEEVLSKAGQAAAAAGLASEPILRVVQRGRVSDLIVSEAERLGCELIVMGTHGRRGLSRLAMGSDAALVLQSGSLPVLLVRAEG
ncbi:MAG: universal stress protein [Proteobacteria bacterium]|nr:universal stress protein [Pseudomonadota bacterium]